MSLAVVAFLVRILRHTDYIGISGFKDEQSRQDYSKNQHTCPIYAFHHGLSRVCMFWMAGMPVLASCPNCCGISLTCRNTHWAGIVLTAFRQGVFQSSSFIVIDR